MASKTAQWTPPLGLYLDVASCQKMCKSSLYMTSLGLRFGGAVPPLPPGSAHLCSGQIYSNVWLEVKSLPMTFRNGHTRTWTLNIMICRIFDLHLLIGASLSEPHINGTELREWDIHIWYYYYYYCFTECTRKWFIKEWEWTWDWWKVATSADWRSARLNWQPVILKREYIIIMVLST